MAQLIAPGATLVTSAEFSVVAGTPKSLYIRAATDGGVIPSSARYDVYYKGSDNLFTLISTLTRQTIDDKGMIVGAGTFKITRRVPADGISSGMDIV